MPRMRPELGRVADTEAAETFGTAAVDFPSSRSLGRKQYRKEEARATPFAASAVFRAYGRSSVLFAAKSEAQ